MQLLVKNFSKLKTKIQLEMINDIFTEYTNINDFIKRKLIEKCDREGISIEEVSLEAKHFYKPSMLYIEVRTLFDLLKGALMYVYQKGRLVYLYQRIYF